ncbi:ATP-binding cassette domain-containing protein [Butyricicoccus intestinisimiae]|uniref:ATP-binding cassette domain-containing protein n=1 Tax=Butyricicoccus intestinisimiae TaxID=2841509 RepID=A0ABS6ETK8_9FIRM|nr:ATP-binding cassette domain-containing protein [Butyricicoccus intestinisimiae]MBU5490466.1 ATP-binding cassette domain-containing protein [Butyricicoccus intestinisimiae]
MIRLEHVAKAYKNTVIFRDLSLEIPTGASVAVTGYNGSGKSVLLKLITGFSRPDSGTITVDGNVIGKDVDFIQNAGVFINAPQFMNSATGYENLMMLAEINRKIGKEQVLQILDRVKLTEAKDKKVRTYSQGMIQRLRIAQAVMEQPDILIMDEPLNALDRDGIDIAHSIFQEYIDDPSKTLLFASHNAEEIKTFATSVLHVENGTAEFQE